MSALMNHPITVGMLVYYFLGWCGCGLARWWYRSFHAPSRQRASRLPPHDVAWRSVQRLIDAEEPE